ncbi:MAG: fumarylacetoacetate hydrolase family protein [Chitinophagaceae bacterium]|nr:fumarylacetoacetate hydrolase family protein [Chitinophagaceae bacterium]
MKIYKTKKGMVVDKSGEYYLLNNENWDEFINRKNLHEYIDGKLKFLTPDRSLSSSLTENISAPVGQQEIWASGVTYLRSREARMEEAKDAGAGDFYARVYEAERPELFFKATASRVVGPGENVRIRRDSKWNVPEPELTLFISSEGSIEGYTIGNDMSSRDIEGENPLYLPQAKSYDASASIGPCIYVPGKPIEADTMIRLNIIRKNESAFSGTISINRMKRIHTELVEYLFRETSFPFGVFLMTGTGIVPPDHFTLEPGDEVEISIDGIGTLINTVSQR